MKRILLGAVLTPVILLLSGLAVLRLGLIPVNADGAHSVLEAKVMPVALRASIARHATSETNPVPLNEDNLKAGVDTYKAMCARCHSTPTSDPSVYGQSFFPPAPPLLATPPSFTEAQLFWLIKHGIRNTGMPAWGGMLSDEEIWQIVAVLKNSPDLPDSVKDGW